MEYPVVLVAEIDVPEQGEVGRIAGREKADVRACAELGYEGGGGEAAEGRGIEGVDEEVDWMWGWGVFEFVKDGVDNLSGLGAEFGEG